MQLIYTVDVSRDPERPLFIYAGSNYQKAEEIAYLAAGRLERYEIALNFINLTKDFNVHDALGRSRTLLGELRRLGDAGRYKNDPGGEEVAKN